MHTIGTTSRALQKIAVEIPGDPRAGNEQILDVRDQRYPRPQPLSAETDFDSRKAPTKIEPSAEMNEDTYF